MNPEKRKSWLELRKSAGISDYKKVYSTQDRSTRKQKEEVEKRDKNAINFREATQKQKDHTEWSKIGAGRFAQRKETK